MTASERASIEAEALEIGWVIDQTSGSGTWFSRVDRRVYAAWSDNGYATYGALANADGDVVDRCEFYSRTGQPAGSWVLGRLRDAALSEPENISQVQPPARMRERLLAEVARLEAMHWEGLIGPRPVAERLRAIAEGRPL